MGNILVLNSGSTSVKYKLFDDKEQQLAEETIFNVDDYEKVIKQLLRQIINLGEIEAVGHRVVHGGDKFREPLLVDQAILGELEELNHYAPLHNPFNVAGVKAAMMFLPGVPQFAVFDTAFYANMPEEAKLYALPKEISVNYGLYRFGFHGTSHEYVMHEASKALGIHVEKINLISCHLGGGCSITAIKGGKAIDTSMGFTPTEGLVMMSRAGDIDPSVVIKLIEDLPGEVNLKKTEMVYNLLNHDSGLKGMSGIGDFKELLKQYSLGQKDATRAFNLYIYRLLKYIGSYWMLLEGKVDALVFTGSVGSGLPITRESVMRKLRFLGEVKALAIQTNEELMITRKIRKLKT